MAKLIKLKVGEDLSEANVLKTIKSLEDGCTKKVACEMLGIAYNTKRLQTIIENLVDRLAYEKSQKAKRRGTPVGDSEAASMIEDYLTNGSMDQIAKTHFRSLNVVKEVLSRNGALLKTPATNYFDPILLPDMCVSTSFENGELVWSARYNCAAEIIKKHADDVYQIWLLGTNNQFAYQPTEELGSLKHLAKLGVRVDRIVRE
jgi:hypothetical protein